MPMIETLFAGDPSWALCSSSACCPRLRKIKARDLRLGLVPAAGSSERTGGIVFGRMEQPRAAYVSRPSTARIGPCRSLASCRGELLWSQFYDNGVRTHTSISASARRTRNRLASAGHGRCSWPGVGCVRLQSLCGRGRAAEEPYVRACGRCRRGPASGSAGRLSALHLACSWGIIVFGEENIKTSQGVEIGRLFKALRAVSFMAPPTRSSASRLSAARRSLSLMVSSESARGLYQVRRRGRSLAARPLSGTPASGASPSRLSKQKPRSHRLKQRNTRRRESLLVDAAHRSGLKLGLLNLSSCSEQRAPSHSQCAGEKAPMLAGGRRPYRAAAGNRSGAAHVHTERARRGD